MYPGVENNEIGNNYDAIKRQLMAVKGGILNRCYSSNQDHYQKRQKLHYIKF